MITGLPEISFVDTDAGTIEASVITMYESIADRTLAQGDPVRLFLQAIAAIIIQQRILIDYSAKQNLLAYAQGDNLDHLGVLVGVPRLQAAAAKTTLRFTLSIAQPQVITIPVGIRATTLNGVVFQVASAIEIPIGALYGDASAECTAPGTVGNGYVAGQINQFVDPLPWVQSVSNITTSSSGADVETDTHYRERIQQAPESFSVAGPDGAYIFWAKTASQDIIDVSVRSPSPGRVEIRPLMINGEIPSSEMLNAVLNVCNDKKIRPLTDQVTVLAPEVVTYNIDLTYYIGQENVATAMAIQQAVTLAVSDYQKWQYSKLGRSINQSVLIQKITNAGASRVDVIAPIYTVLQTYQVAIAETVAANFGGLEDGD